MDYELQQSTAARIPFVMIASDGSMVDGLSGALTIEISKAGGAFAAATGAQGEISDGWYYYDITAAETDTVGGLSILITGAGAIQQNLLCHVRSYSISCIEFTYTVTDSGTGLPIAGVEVGVSSDIGGSNIVWNGTTDAFGVARDPDDELPCLDAGTWYFWSYKVGYNFVNPDAEVVS